MKKLLFIVIAILSLTVAFDASAKKKKPKGPALEFDQLVTPDLIFGGGNTNGFFTTGRKNGIEVGLRAKSRFPKEDLTAYNNGDGTYIFPAGNPCPGGFGFAPNCFTTPLWSFDWSINTNFAGVLGGPVVSDFIYELGLDADPSQKTDYTVFDNITPTLFAPLFDHAFGDNATANGAGSGAVSIASYAFLLGDSNVVQNSWNYEFFNFFGNSLEFFDPSVAGEYSIYLKVKDPSNGRTLAESRILVVTE